MATSDKMLSYDDKYFLSTDEAFERACEFMERFAILVNKHGLQSIDERGHLAMSENSSKTLLSKFIVLMQGF